MESKGVKNRVACFLKRSFKGLAVDRTLKDSVSQYEAPLCKGDDSFCQAGIDQEYNPNPGHRGKDVEWVPASQVVINRMFEITKVTAEDYVIDLGSGDGRMVIGAARLGARALGIEFNPRMVELSRKNAEREGLTGRAAFVQADFFNVDFSSATVLTLFLREDINLALRPKILDMRPGTRIVSNIFNMGDWQADEIAEVEDEDYYFRNHTVYYWVVPARVKGAWKFPLGELRLDQGFQMINGYLRSDTTVTPVTGKMTGGRIGLTAGGRQYAGCVNGDLMELKTNNGGNEGWSATLVLSSSLII